VVLSGRAYICTAQGKVDRKVPLAGRAAVALEIEMYLKESRLELLTDAREPALFVSKRPGTRLTVAGIQTVVEAHAKAAGVPGPLHPHALRHTCATHLLQCGADVREIQQLLGHKSLRSTMLYTRVGIAYLDQVNRKSHPRERTRRGGKIRRS
jgi:integrase/recombinase XerC